MAESEDVSAELKCTVDFPEGSTRLTDGNIAVGERETVLKRLEAVRAKARGDARTDDD
jgi:hypothetical protein